MQAGRRTTLIEKPQESASQVQSPPSFRVGAWTFGIIGRDAVDNECVDVADSLESDIICRLGGGSRDL